jgi:hypothetical protein
MASRFPPLLTALLACALALTGCGNSQPNPTAPNIIPGGPGDTSFSRLGGENSGVIFGTTKDRPGSAGGGGGGGGGGSGIGVNAFLWRGALDTLSFLPLSSADPFGGVIITDWYSPSDASGERFKATAYILGRDLRSDAIRVSVFRQVNQGGRWVDAPVDPVVQADIENKVLDRARRLREQSTSQSQG